MRLAVSNVHTLNFDQDNEAESVRYEVIRAEDEMKADGKGAIEVTNHPGPDHAGTYFPYTSLSFLLLESEFLEVVLLKSNRTSNLSDFQVPVVRENRRWTWANTISSGSRCLPRMKKENN